MAAPGLERLLALGLLAPKRPDRAQAGRWLARSRKDLHLARDVLASVDRERAMAVAYEAGYRACVAIIDLAGYRITSQPGHHRAAIDAAGLVLGPERRALLRRLDRARRFRNETLYGEMPAVGRAEFEQLLKDVGWLIGELDERIGHPSTSP